MFRKLLGLAALTATLALVAGCGQTPVKMGAAAIVGDERITTAEVQDAVRSLRDGQQRLSVSASQLRLPDPQSLPRSELMLLLQFHIVEEAARNEGITVTDADIDGFIADQPGGREDLARRALVSGIPPSHLREVVRQILIREELVARVAPEAADPQQAALRVQEYLVRFARDLGVTVSPRYGKFDYETMTVAPAADTRLSRPESPAPGAT